MNALAAGQFRPGLEALGVEQVPQPKSSVDDELPLDAFAGIQVEYQRIGVFDIVDGRRPRMQLNDTNFDKAQQAGEIIDP